MRLVYALVLSVIVAVAILLLTRLWLYMTYQSLRAEAITVAALVGEHVNDTWTGKIYVNGMNMTLVEDNTMDHIEIVLEPNSAVVVIPDNGEPKIYGTSSGETIILAKGNYTIAPVERPTLLINANKYMMVIDIVLVTMPLAVVLVYTLYSRAR